MKINKELSVEVKKLFANSFLVTVLLGLLVAPIASLGLSKVTPDTAQVLSAQDENIEDPRIKEYQDLILELKQQLRETTQSSETSPLEE